MCLGPCQIQSILQLLVIITFALSYICGLWASIIIIIIVGKIMRLRFIQRIVPLIILFKYANQQRKITLSTTTDYTELCSCIANLKSNIEVCDFELSATTSRELCCVHWYNNEWKLHHEMRNCKRHNSIALNVLSYVHVHYLHSSSSSCCCPLLGRALP